MEHRRPKPFPAGPNLARALACGRRVRLPADGWPLHADGSLHPRGNYLHRPLRIGISVHFLVIMMTSLREFALAPGHVEFIALPGIALVGRPFDPAARHI